MKNKYWIGFSKRNIFVFFVISLVPLIIWSILNFFLVRSGYSDLTYDLLQSKRNQFNRNIELQLSGLDSIPHDFNKISPDNIRKTVEYMANDIRSSFYLRKGNTLSTLNWLPSMRSVFEQPNVYNPLLNLSAYLFIDGKDTLLITYSMTDILHISGVSDSLLLYKEKVAYLDPLGQLWDLPGFPPLHLDDERLIAKEKDIFETFNFFGWSFPLKTSPDKKEAGKLIIAYNRSELFSNWNKYQLLFPVGIVILSIITLFFGVFVGMRLSKALRLLINSTQQMGRGQFDKAIRVSGTREIEELSKALEEMRKKLKEIYGDLEKAVNKRTIDLQEAQFQIVHQEKMASIGLLAAGIAHEIGNPLTSISSIVQVLKRKSNNNQMNEYLMTIHENIERISKIVRELVDFSRPSRHIMHPTNINKTVDSAVGIIKYDKRVRDIDFFVQLDENMPDIFVVEDQLMQVVVNLLVNAIDAIKSDLRKIEVWTHFNDDFVFIDLKDSGSGISSENLQKIFEPFYTTKEVGKGTGLGLSVSYGIVQNFGGEIKVESSPGKGSKFTIVLPIRNESQNPENFIIKRSE